MIESADFKYRITCKETGQVFGSISEVIRHFDLPDCYRSNFQRLIKDQKRRKTFAGHTWKIEKVVKYPLIKSLTTGKIYANGRIAAESLKDEMTTYDKRRVADRITATAKGTTSNATVTVSGEKLTVGDWKYLYP